MVTVDFGTTILALDRVTAVRNSDGKVVKLRDIAVSCLLSTRPDGADQKMQDASLAEKVHNSKTGAPLSAEEVSRIKSLIADTQGPLIMKRCWDILDPRGEEE